ncbi:MAG: sulfite exporter TauE/SafE family protein [Planctomycetes bacterium]|nr:sulfite exporter TauE/SafE family protein [Planctomycetota bacterium]
MVLILLGASSPDLLHMAALLLIGAGAGLLGGLLGIGGGLVMIPAMVLLFGNSVYGENSFHLYKLAALSTAVVLSVPAVRQHARARAIVRPMLWGIVPLGLAGVVIGVGLARVFADEYTEILRRTFGVFMLLAVGANIWRRRRGDGGAESRDRCPVSTRRLRIGTIVGLPAGIIAGLLGVGGGVWAVPAQNYALGVRLPNAIANSACMIIGLAAGATVMQSLAIASLHDPLVPVRQAFWLALWLAPGAIVGGSIGGRLTHTLPVDLIRNVFYMLLAVTGLRLAVF